MIMERAELAEQILSSLELSPDQEIDQLWAEEAVSHLDAFQKDQIKAVSAKEVFHKNKKLSLNWAGGLKKFRKQFTALELQNKSLEWWGD